MYFPPGRWYIYFFRSSKQLYKTCEPVNGIPSNSAILQFWFVKLVFAFTEVHPTELCDQFNVRDKREWTIEEKSNVLSLVTEKLLIPLRDKENGGEARSPLSVEDN